MDVMVTVTMVICNNSIPYIKIKGLPLTYDVCKYMNISSSTSIYVCVNLSTYIVRLITQCVRTVNMYSKHCIYSKSVRQTQYTCDKPVQQTWCVQ